MRRVFSTDGTMLIGRKFLFNLFFVAGGHVIDVFAFSAGEFNQVIL